VDGRSYTGGCRLGVFDASDCTWGVPPVLSAGGEPKRMARHVWLPLGDLAPPVALLIWTHGGRRHETGNGSMDGELRSRLL